MNLIKEKIKFLHMEMPDDFILQTFIGNLVHDVQ